MSAAAQPSAMLIQPVILGTFRPECLRGNTTQILLWRSGDKVLHQTFVYGLDRPADWAAPFKREIIQLTAWRWEDETVLGIGSAVERDTVSPLSDMAIRRARPQPGLIVHSDRGSEFANARFHQRATEAHLRLSMSSTGNCYDNASAESFFATLKLEAIRGQVFASRLEARQEIFDYIIDQMKDMYQKAELVHADLSEYNILMKEQTPIIIDVGQAVLTNHPMAQEFLVRDVKNIIKFFNKHGVEADNAEVIEMIRGET